MARRVRPGVRAASAREDPEKTPCGQLILGSGAHALGELDRDGPLTQQELGARLQWGRSAVSQRVSQLASRGWFTAGKRGAEARVWWVELTARRGAPAAHDGCSS
ncbi:MAG: MarR family transcriptional regulator [Mycobacteriaceae bacterium]